jgi:predicted deacylase
MKNIEQHERFYRNSEKPEIIYEMGVGSPMVIFNVAAHGNEPQPVLAVEEFLKEFNDKDLLAGKVRFTLSNPAALRAGKRFLSQDLNRAYPGNILGQGEARIAAQVMKLVVDADYVVDLHTAPDPPPFVILGARNEEKLRLAEFAPIRPIVLFEAKEPCAMVDFTKCGIGIELGSHESNDSAALGVKTINRFLSGVGLVDNSAFAEEHDYYEIFRGLTTEEIPEYLLEDLKNFQPVVNSELGIQTEDEFSYPVLCGAKDYTAIFCYLAKKVARENLTNL